MTVRADGEDRQLFQAIQGHQTAETTYDKGVAVSKVIHIVLDTDSDSIRAAASRWLWREYSVLVTRTGAPAPRIEAL